MVQISFYNYTAQSLEMTLVLLLNKALDQKIRVVVLTGSEDQTSEINTALWTYAQGSFLPHGSKEDGHSKRQPIYVTDILENPNQATLLVVISNQIVQDFQKFERCLDIFDGNTSEHVKQARQRWQSYKKNKVDQLTYWYQNEQKWLQKNISEI